MLTWQLSAVFLKLWFGGTEINELNLISFELKCDVNLESGGETAEQEKHFNNN